MMSGNRDYGSITVLEKNLGRDKSSIFHNCILQLAQRGIQRQEGEF